MSKCVRRWLPAHGARGTTGYGCGHARPSQGRAHLQERKEESAGLEEQRSRRHKNKEVADWRSTRCPSGFSPLLGGSSSARTGFGRSRPTTRGRSRRSRPDSWPPPATPKQHGAPRGTRAQRGGATLRGVRRGKVARRLWGSPDLHPLRRVQGLRQRRRTKGEAPAGTARPQPPRATRRLRGGVRPTIQRRRPAGRADYNPRRGSTSSARTSSCRASARPT